MSCMSNNLSSTQLNNSNFVTPPRNRNLVTRPPPIQRTVSEVPPLTTGYDVLTAMNATDRSVEGGVKRKLLSSPSDTTTTTMTPDTTTTTMTPDTMLRRTFSALPGQGIGSFSEHVMNACDSDGNVNNAQLNQSTIDAGLHKAAKAQSLSELMNLRSSMRGFRYSSDETREFTAALDMMKATVQEQSCIWDEAPFDFEECVTLDHEGKSISEMTSLLGSNEVMGLDVMALCESPSFTVSRVIETTVGRMYHMAWNAKPSVKLIVTEATACLMFVRKKDGVEEIETNPYEDPYQAEEEVDLMAEAQKMKEDRMKKLFTIPVEGSKLGGRLDKKSARDYQQTFAELKSTQANAKDSNDKKRKAVENTEEEPVLKK